MAKNIVNVLTIAGSDTSAGAGVFADLKVFNNLYVYGTAAITAITSQNTLGVQDIFCLPTEIVAKQLDSILNDLNVNAVKTGMLYSAEIIEVIKEKLQKYAVPNLVIDPVLISTSGKRLLQENAYTTLKVCLFPLAEVVTPNIPEAGILTGLSIKSISQMKKAAENIHKMGCANVVVKGGHLPDCATDVLFDGNQHVEFEAKRKDNNSVHGTGCVFSAVITAELAKGSNVYDAVSCAKDYITSAIEQAVRIGKGRAVFR